MPPRYAYWTIIAGGLPTAFRAADRDELMPTFQRIREKHPDAQMKWFARGKLWESPDAARVRRDENRGGDRRGGRWEHDQRGQPADHRRAGPRPNQHPRDRPPLSDEARRAKPQRRPDEAGREKRGREWRPGGEHRDPRQKFIDAKKQRNAALRTERWQKKNTPPREGEGGRAVSGDRPQDSRNQSRGRPPAKGGWRPKPGGSSRKPGFRGQGTEEPQEPQRPRGPNREPRPDETPEPTPPPRPTDPIVPPPGPPERGHPDARRPFQPRGGFQKNRRRY